MDINNDFEISFDENNEETVYFNKYEFLYQRKDKGSAFNSHTLRVTPTQLDFYEKANLNDNSYRTYSIKVDHDLSFIKISEVYNFGVMYKTDISTCDKDGVPSIEEIHRKYNKDGHLVISSIEYRPLEIGLAEFIKFQLNNSGEVNRLHNRIEELMPGVSESLKDINSDYNYVINNNKQYKKKI